MRMYETFGKVPAVMCEQCSRKVKSAKANKQGASSTLRQQAGI